MTKGITVYTLFLVIAIFLSLSFLFLLVVKYLKPPEGKEKEFCQAKVKSYCMEWYSKGFSLDNRPEGYDFSVCEKFGITEPDVSECKAIVGVS